MDKTVDSTVKESCVSCSTIYLCAPMQGRAGGLEDDINFVFMKSKLVMSGYPGVCVCDVF